MDEPIPSIEQPTTESKPTPPKLKAGVPPKRTSMSTTKSSTASVMKTPVASTARTTTGTTLNKPPARPAVASTFKKPTASSTNAANAANATRAHKPRASMSSVDENTKPILSGDEKKSKPALGAPKRLSMAGSTASARLGERKPPIQPTTGTEKKANGKLSTLSPPKITQSPSAGSRQTTASNVSSLRAAGVGDAKKRLSTIPASPLTKKTNQNEHEKENDRQAVSETSKGKGVMRPPLGQRQSTRSATIQQRIHEYELVNEMLQAAMAAEDAGDETEKEHLTNEVDEAITQLKANLEVTEEASTAEKSTMLQESTESISLLESQLQNSKATVGTLKQELEELRTQLEESRKTGESAVESTNAAHSAEIEELKKKHELEVSSIHQQLQELELKQQEREEQSLGALEDARRSAIDAGDMKTSQLLEEQKSLHSKAVEALENDLAIKRKAIKDSADKVSLLEKEIEEHKANLATITSEAGEQVKLIESHQDQLTQKDRELQGRDGVIKNLQQEIVELQEAKVAEAEALRQSSGDQIAELQAQLAAARSEAEASKQSSSDQIAELEAQISSLKSAADRSSEESAAANAHTQEELVQKEQEITNLGQVIGRLQDEIQGVHESSSNELDERLLQIRQEHDQIIMAMKAEHQVSIDGLAKSHNDVVEKLAVEARNNRTAHEKQTQVMGDERAELQKSLDSAADSLKVSNEEAEKRIQEVELKHNEALTTVNEELQRAQNAFADSEERLKQSMEDSKEAMASTVKTLEEKIQALEGQAAKDASALKSAHCGLEAAHHQVDSLKQVLETIEKESQSRDEHHTNSLKKATGEAEMARRALAEKSSSIEESEQNHAQALDELKSRHEADTEQQRTDLTQKHEQTLEQLKSKYGADIEQQRADLTQKHEQALEELKTKLDDLSAARSDLEKTHKKEIENIKSEHHRVLADSSKMIADLQQAHFVELDETRRQLADEHSEATKQMEEEFLRRAADVERTHHAALDDLQSTHEKTVLGLRGEFEESQLKREATTKESHEVIVKELQAQLERQQADLAKARLEAQKASEPAEDPELAELKSSLQMSNDALTAAKTEASTLANEVDQMRERLERDQKTTSKLESAAAEASRARAESSSREVNALKEQLDGALQEVETQRANSDIAKKELQESVERMKQSSAHIEELEARLQAVTERLDSEPKLSTSGSTRRRNRNKGSKNSPNLAQEKWTGEASSGDAPASPTSQKEGENLGSSIQGTMASIKEQLRQLDEVNEDMLEGHARMANMLSNVPESPVPSPSTPTTAV